MKLAEYLEREGLTDAAFAALVRIDRSVVSRWRRGETRPDWCSLDRISAATRGEVTPNDFVMSDDDASSERAA